MNRPFNLNRNAWIRLLVCAFVMLPFLRLAEINFYLGDRISSFYKRRPAEGFLLTGDEDAAKYFPQFESEGYTFEERYVAPRPVLGQQARVYKFKK